MADRKDAELIVQLLQWGTALGIEDSVRAVFDDGFDPAAATAEDENVYRVLNYGESLGTLTKNGLLDTELVLDLWWIAGLWQRVGPAASKLREKHGVPELFENFEALARKQA